MPVAAAPAPTTEAEQASAPAITAEAVPSFEAAHTTTSLFRVTWIDAFGMMQSFARPVMIATNLCMGAASVRCRCLRVAQCTTGVLGRASGI